MRKAIEQVAGRQVRGLALTSYYQLVANYTLARSSGFVEAAEPVGLPEEADGVYRQRFRIRVKAGEINRDLVAQKIDVDFLYEIVARPRIALAMRDEWRPPGSSAGWESDGRALSSQEITRYFKERHAGFIFKDLDLLRDSREEQIDYVREAHRARYDILIVGLTRGVLRSALEPHEVNAWQARRSDANIRGKRYAWDVETEWRAVNVATAETLFTVTGRYATPETEAPEQRQSADAALVWAKRRLLEEKVPELFRELLAEWNRNAFSQGYEIVFRVRGAMDPEDLRKVLIGAGGFSPEAVRLVTAGANEIVFGASSPQSGADQADQLRTAFAPRFIVQEIRPGRVVLALVDGRAAEGGVRLEVVGMSFTELSTFQQQIESVPGILKMRREEFAAGKAVWTIETTRTVDELARTFEQGTSPRLQVMAIVDRRIEARRMEGKP